MSAKVTPRDTTVLLQKFRTFLLGGRKGKNYLRFEGLIAKRTQPQPNLPPGPHSKLSANYYYTRDARRELNPPLLVAGDQALLEAPKTEEVRQFRTPGKTFQWDAPL